MEIGSTWIAPSWQGTFVNAEAKFLMLRHAFRKLGAAFEGRLRNHGILPDGFVRDTLMFRIMDSEWPQVRDRLGRRLLG